MRERAGIETALGMLALVRRRVCALLRTAAGSTLLVACAAFAAKPNQAPTVTLTSPVNGATYAAPATISLTATASDADGTIAKVEFFQGVTRIGTALAAPYAVSWPNVPAGKYSVTAKATDSAGATTTSTAASVTVAVPNVAPLVVLTAPDACIVYDAPASIVLGADAVDPDGSIARVDFLQGTTVVGSSTASPFMATWTNVVAGTYSVAARATDERGGVAMSTPVTVIVRPANQLPAVSLSSPQDGAVFNAPASIALAASATDPDGSVAKVDFVVDGATIGSATAVPYQFTLASPVAGMHAIAARATDNAGGVASSPVSRITVNGPPVVQISSPSADALFTAPASIAITATASASAGFVSRLEFYDGATLIGTIPASSTPVNATFTYGAVPAGSHLLTVKATDSAGLSATSPPRTVTVNDVPAVSLTSPAAGAQFGAPATVNLAATASVGFGSIARVDFLANGNVVATATAIPYGAVWSNVAAGSYSLTARATTTAGVSATSSATPITISAVDLTIDEPAEGATLYQGDVVVNGRFGGVTVSSLTVNGVAAGVGNRSFAAVVPLQSGSNVLSVVAETSQGTVNRTLHVTRTQPSVTVASVANGQVIRDDRVTLFGTAHAPSNSAVIVNGQLANLAPDGTFFINDLPLAPGPNTIDIALNTPETATQATASVARSGRPGAKAVAETGLALELERDGLAPFVLDVDVVEGFAPLTVNMRLTNRLAYVYDELRLDIEGDGQVDYGEAGLPVPILEREFQVTYAGAGVFRPTLTLTRLGNEVIFSTTKGINVHSVNTRADQFKGIYQTMLNRLAAGDIAGAANMVSTTIRDSMVATFNLLSPRLATVVERLGTVREATMYPGYAELVVGREKPDGTYGYRVYITYDGDGLWRIDDM